MPDTTEWLITGQLATLVSDNGDNPSDKPKEVTLLM